MDLAKKQRKIEVNYKPLKTSASMEVVGSVAGSSTTPSQESSPPTIR